MWKTSPHLDEHEITTKYKFLENKKEFSKINKVDYKSITMNTYTKYLMINTKKQRELVNITEMVEDAVEESRVKEGICLVNAMHITSSVFINDNEAGLHEDIMVWLEALAPEDPNYKHHRTGETNADAHLKRTIMGREVVVAITNGKLDFGPWETIFYGEFDGQRDKRILIKIIGE
jgi:secondary thiamine-phosphate synthase enzyme